MDTIERLGQAAFDRVLSRRGTTVIDFDRVAAASTEPAVVKEAA